MRVTVLRMADYRIRFKMDGEYDAEQGTFANEKDALEWWTSYKQGPSPQSREFALERRDADGWTQIANRDVGPA